MACARVKARAINVMIQQHGGLTFFQENTPLSIRYVYVSILGEFFAT